MIRIQEVSLVVLHHELELSVDQTNTMFEFAHRLIVCWLLIYLHDLFFSLLTLFT